MGCGTSLNDNDVKSPQSSKSHEQIPATDVYDSNPQIKPITNQNIDIRQIKTEKSIMPVQSVSAKEGVGKEEEVVESKNTVPRIYLFGESKDQRKIVQFQALPAPHIEILLSRTHVPPPVKYQPIEIIMEQSQQLNSSHMYLSTSHPPYNYMYATFIKNNTIFLCGGVNFGFDNVSNEAFIYNVKEENVGLNGSPMKNQSAIAVKKQRRIGNNLMGTKFQRLPYMKQKRYSHMGVFYKAGKLSYVYIFGGMTENGETLSKCQKYSISQGKWSEIAPMNAPRSTAFSLIVNKKIYIFGGYSQQGKRSKKIERYNPSFDSWQTLNVKLHKGIETGMLLPCHLPNQILIVGGNVEFGAIKTVLRVNFQNQTYIWDSDMKKQRLLQKGIPLLQQNSAYVLGGDFEDTVQRYSYKDKTWKIVNNLHYGQCVSPEEINAFTLAQQTIELKYQNQSSIKQSKQTEVQSNNDFKYVFGSDDYPCIFQINTNKWVVKKKVVPMTLRLRCHMSVAKIKEGKIFIAGGIDAYYEKPTKAAYIYYPGTNKAIEIAKIKEKKYGFAVCVYDNFVYIFGGQTAKQGAVLSTVQKYDVAQDKWTQLSDLPRERTYARAFVGPANKIYLIGGTDCLYQNVSQIDIFDPQIQKFQHVEMSFPLACQIKYAEFTGKVERKQAKKSNGQFQFLDDEENKSQVKPVNNQQQQKQPKVQQNNQQITYNQVHEMLVFGYNSYRKQDEAYLLSIQKQKLTYEEKSYKLYPFSLSFKITPAQKLQTSQQSLQVPSNPSEPTHYFISNKGFFKWQQSKKQIDSQIVINQMHLLQMPLEKMAIV